jgi:hypothetical protein
MVQANGELSLLFPFHHSHLMPYTAELHVNLPLKAGLHLERRERGNEERRKAGRKEASDSIIFDAPPALIFCVFRASRAPY